MSRIIVPHGEKGLTPVLLQDEELQEEIQKAREIPKIKMTSRETSDLLMMAIGAFSPLTGFMGKKDWQGVCDQFTMNDGTFWPIPITLSTDTDSAKSLEEGQRVALISDEDQLMGSMTIEEKYAIDKHHECKQVFKTDDPKHPGVAKVMEQGEVNLAGPVKAFSEGHYPKTYGGLYARPKETREIFESKGWSKIAALQLRNPMHRAHEYLAKIALEVMDGLFIHQLVGKLKEGDIPADVRVNCVNTLIDNYFPKDSVVVKVYPMEMRYGGPREALLHACFRQNYGASHLIVGRDHAGVGDYYGPHDAQNIFDEIPKDKLKIQSLNIEWTFYCYKCQGMISLKTCPHKQEDRLFLSGTMLRKLLSEGKNPPPEFSRPEVLDILKEYYARAEDTAEIKLHKHARGE